MELHAKNTNDTDIQFTRPQAVTPEFDAIMKQLGFVPSQGGSYVYDAGGRAIWVDCLPGSVSGIVPQIVKQAEEIGKRTKINEIRKALDLPFGVIDALSPSK